MVVTPEAMEVKMNDSSESAHPPAMTASTTAARVADGALFVGAVAPQNGASAQPTEAETPEAERAPFSSRSFLRQLSRRSYRHRCSTFAATTVRPSTMCRRCLRSATSADALSDGSIPRFENSRSARPSVGRQAGAESPDELSRLVLLPGSRATSELGRSHQVPFEAHERASGASPWAGDSPTESRSVKTKAES